MGDMFIFRDIRSGELSGADMTFQLTQGHRKWHSLIYNIRLPTHVPY